MVDKPVKRGRASGPGWTPFAAAKQCEMPWAKFKRAFGDQVRITDAEVRRIRLLHGLPVETETRPAAERDLLRGFFSGLRGLFPKY